MVRVKVSRRRVFRQFLACVPAWKVELVVCVWHSRSSYSTRPATPLQWLPQSPSPPTTQALLPLPSPARLSTQISASAVALLLPIPPFSVLSTLYPDISFFSFSYLTAVPSIARHPSFLIGIGKSPVQYPPPVKQHSSPSAFHLQLLVGVSHTHPFRRHRTCPVLTELPLN